tara:strand:- start:2238 stop:2609 length:372 start_codon:yes stop_codon:yes gene_type:complete
MLSTNITNGEKNQNQEQFSVSNRSSHEQQYPFLREFSRLIKKVPIKILEEELLTYKQKEFAKALWEANNYGGSIEKCRKRLKEIHGEKWEEVTTIGEHMEGMRDYYESVLIIDHKRQWDKKRK